MLSGSRGTTCGEERGGAATNGSSRGTHRYVVKVLEADGTRGDLVGVDAGALLCVGDLVQVLLDRGVVLRLAPACGVETRQSTMATGGQSGGTGPGCVSRGGRTATGGAAGGQGGEGGPQLTCFATSRSMRPQRRLRQRRETGGTRAGRSVSEGHGLRQAPLRRFTGAAFKTVRRGLALMVLLVLLR